MDLEALDAYLSLFFWAATAYLGWSLTAGRVHVPARRPGMETAIYRQNNPITYWLLWGAYAVLVTFIGAKSYPFGF